jgi:hypothetical protein
MGVELELSTWIDRYKLWDGIGGTISNVDKKNKMSVSATLHFRHLSCEEFELNMQVVRLFLRL